MSELTHEQMMDQNAYDNLRKENAMLRAKLAQAQERIQQDQGLVGKINELTQQLAHMTQERNAFGKSLNQYGSHFRHCLGIAKCECGLDAEITTPNYLDLNCDLQQQLAQAKQERDDLRKDRDDAVDMREGSLMRVDGLQQQLAQAKQDLADLPTLRKDLSMCLIQLQEARGSILSMESEVDMVRAQLAARRA